MYSCSFQSKQGLEECQQTSSLGKMNKKIPHRLRMCLPYARKGVWSGVSIKLATIAAARGAGRGVGMLSSTGFTAAQSFLSASKMVQQCDTIYCRSLPHKVESKPAVVCTAAHATHGTNMSSAYSPRRTRWYDVIYLR